MRRYLLLISTVSILLALPVAGSPARAQKDHPDGAESQVLYRGAETLLVSYPPAKGKARLAAGWDLPESYSIHSYALSRDGKKIWLLLNNGAFDLKDLRWQVWSLKADG